MVSIGAVSFFLFRVGKIQFRDPAHFNPQQTGNQNIHFYLGEHIDLIRKKEIAVFRNNQIHDDVFPFGIFVI